MSYTKGPWKVEKDSKYHQQNYTPIVADSTRLVTLNTVAWAISSEEEPGDNARLIAAAPELLETLDEILDNQLRFGEVPAYLLEKAVDVLAKAKGEPK